MNLTELKRLSEETNKITLNYYSVIYNYIRDRNNNNLIDNEITTKYQDFDINNLL